MDALDKRILTAIQAGLPAEERPFDALAARLSPGGDGPGNAIDADDLIARVRQMVGEGLVRRIGPVFDSRQLGYASTLVAARVAPEQLDATAATVSRLPGVTHNYERRGAYNLWFTLTAPSAAELERTLEALRREADVMQLHSLPALTVYKIRVQFDMEEQPECGVNGNNNTRGQQQGSPSPLPLSRGGERGEEAAALTEVQKELVRAIQDGLAAEREPWADAAARVGWTAGQVVEQVREWMAAGVIRRLGAVVRHRELGFHANGMAVFRVPDERIDEAGRRLAAFAEVSHCYRRPPLPDFAYNLYAMVHGRSEGDVRATVERMASEIEPVRGGCGHPPREDRCGIEHDVLFSVREFKKASMRYFVE